MLIVYPVNSLPGHFREFLTGFWYRDPVLRAIAINVQFRIEPTRVIEGTGTNKRQFRVYSEIGRYWRTALGTEVSLNRSTAITSVVKCLEFPLNRYCRFRNCNHHREGRSRLLLAFLAMAHSDHGRICVRGITDLAAETATAHLTHFVLLILI